MLKKKKIEGIDTKNLPVHVAIIPDGNRRWAKKRGLAPVFGHREGVKRIKEITRYCSNTGIRYVSFYIFSTENWTRQKKEVDELMSLIVEFLRNADKELESSAIKINIIGSRSALSEELLNEIERIEGKTLDNSGTTLNLFLNYGGRKEILDAIERISRSGIEKIDEQSFRSFLYKPELPDPDLVIRTSGEIRISNFLIWQNAYSELYFSEKMWPAFTVEEFRKALEIYQKRTRRYGGA